MIDAFSLPVAVAQTAGPDLVPSVWRMLGGLVVVLGLLLGLAWLLRRGAIAKRGSGVLSVETALPLGDRRSLVIVAVEGRRLLIGLSQHQVSLVTELQTPAPAFAQVLQKATAGESSR
jgi:flagellar protein FliO/FliZ